MDRNVVLCGLALAVLLWGAAGADVITAGDAAAWRDDFSAVRAWQARPDWQPNPDATAAVSSDGQSACFRVTGPDKGMKWSRSFAPVSIADAPYLYLRYRAVNVRTGTDDYLVYVDDHAPSRECRPIRLQAMVSDGQWHAVAVDLRPIAQGPDVDAVAIQVQTGPAEHAELWVDELGFSESPPPASELLGAQAGQAAKPDFVLDLDHCVWTAKPAWLGSPAARHDVSRGDAKGPVVFRVNDAGNGMKWSSDLEGEIDLNGYRYLAMRYRAQGLRPYQDYALSLLGKPNDGGAYEEIVRGSDLQSDGQWHVAAAPLNQNGDSNHFSLGKNGYCPHLENPQSAIITSPFASHRPGASCPHAAPGKSRPPPSGPIPPPPRPAAAAWRRPTASIPERGCIGSSTPAGKR